MSNSLSIEICNGEQCKYYKLNNIKYHIRFPLDYALNLDPEQLGCGPEKCDNCLVYGSIRGVFVGYCKDCIGEFQNTRGNRPDADYKYLSQKEFEQCLPYMKGIKIEDIGDEVYQEDYTDCQQGEEYDDEHECDAYYEEEQDELYKKYQQEKQERLENGYDDYWGADDYDEPDEYGITEYERCRIPHDLRALDPRYQAQLADFRDYAR